MPPQCACGLKVDRIQEGVQCVKCKKMLHASCCNIKLDEIEFVKNSYKCVNCLNERRTSFSSLPVVVPELCDTQLVVTKSDESSATVFVTGNATAELGDKVQIAISDNVDEGLSKCSCRDSSFITIIDTLKMLMSEVSALKKSNETLHTVVELLRSDNDVLVKKIEVLQSAVQSINTNEPVISPKRKKSNVAKRVPNDMDRESNVAVILSKNVAKTSSNRVIAESGSADAVSKPVSYAAVSRSTEGDVAISANDKENLISKNNNNITLITKNNKSNDSNWSVVAKKMKESKSVTGSYDTNELGVFDRFKWLHISSFKKTVSADDVINYIAKHSKIPIKHFSCYKLVKNGSNIEDLKFVNFKLGVSSNFYNDIFNPSLWPSNIKVRPFIFLEKESDVAKN